MNHNDPTDATARMKHGELDLVPDGYTLEIDGPRLRLQRELLQRLFDTACRQEPIFLGSEETGLLEGLLNLTDTLADQAADRYGIDCLLQTQEQEPRST